jgi:hypothetical protein
VGALIIYPGRLCTSPFVTSLLTWCRNACGYTRLPFHFIVCTHQFLKIPCCTSKSIRIRLKLPKPILFCLYFPPAIITLSVCALKHPTSTSRNPPGIASPCQAKAILCQACVKHRGIQENTPKGSKRIWKGSGFWGTKKVDTERSENWWGFRIPSQTRVGSHFFYTLFRSVVVDSRLIHPLLLLQVIEHPPGLLPGRRGLLELLSTATKVTNPKLAS